MLKRGGFIWDVPLALPLAAPIGSSSGLTQRELRYWETSGSRAWISLSRNSSPLFLTLSMLSRWNRVAEVRQKIPANWWSWIFKAPFVAQPLPLSQLKLALSPEALRFTAELINTGRVSSAAWHLAALVA